MKKENILMIVVCVLLVGFVMFLPNIDNLVSGRKIEVHKEKKEEKKQPTEYICTSTTESSLASESKKIIFTLSKEGKVTTIDTTTITAYHSKEEYNTNKKASENLKAEGITYHVVPDDANFALTIQSVQDISKNSSTPYPIEYKELNNYLVKNNYICSSK